MTAYRNDIDAAHYLAEQRELDIKDLSHQVVELTTRNRSLEMIAKELLNGDPCTALSRRIDELERENTILSMENALLKKDPKTVIAEQIAAWETQTQEAHAELRRTYRQLRYVGVCFAVSVATMVAGRLFW
jgi:hypothetical protein